MNARLVGLCFVIGSASFGCTVDPSLFVGGPRKDAGANRKDAADDRSSPSDAEDASVDAEVDASSPLDASDGPIDPGDVAKPTDDACVAQVAPVDREVCDGIDNDCDGMVDEGCPKGLSLVLGVDRPLIGVSTGGTRAWDDCGKDEVLVGIHAEMNDWLWSLAGICAPVTLAVDKSAVPFRYSAAVGVHRQLSPRGSGGTLVRDLACEGNQILVGIRASSYYAAQFGNVVIPELWVSCATFVVTHDEDAGTYTFAPTDTAELPSFKGPSPSDANTTRDDLLADLVPVRLIVKNGSWIDQFGLGDATMAVVLQQ